MIAQTPSTAKLPSALIQSVAEIGLKARKWAREEVTGLRLPCRYYSVWQLAGSKRPRPWWGRDASDAMSLVTDGQPTGPATREAPEARGPRRSFRADQLDGCSDPTIPSRAESYCGSAETTVAIVNVAGAAAPGATLSFHSIGFTPWPLSQTTAHS